MSPRTIITLITLDLLLMAFSIVLWKIGNDAMAATAAAGAIALAADIARRLLGSPPVAPTPPGLPGPAIPQPLPAPPPTSSPEVDDSTSTGQAK